MTPGTQLNGPTAILSNPTESSHLPFFSDESKRQKLKDNAATWLGTPFFPNGRIKGVGVSCQTFVSMLYAEAGFIVPLEAPDGPVDWAHAHKESIMEPFIDGKLAAYLAPVTGWPQCGDLMGFKVGGCVHHLGICLGGEFIHTLNKKGVFVSRVDDATFLKRLARVWRPLAI